MMELTVQIAMNIQAQFATIVTDLDKSSLLEIVDSHKSDDIIAVLKQQPESIRAQVEEVCVDMWGGFPQVIRAVFPHAKIVKEFAIILTIEQPVELRKVSIQKLS